MQRQDALVSRLLAFYQARKLLYTDVISKDKQTHAHRAVIMTGNMAELAYSSPLS